MEAGVLGTWLGDSTQEKGGNGKQLKLGGGDVCVREFKPAAGRKSKGSQISWLKWGCGAEGREGLQHLQVLPQKLHFAAFPPSYLDFFMGSELFL